MLTGILESTGKAFNIKISSLKFKHKSVQDQGSNNDHNFALEDGLPTVVETN